MIIYMCHTLRVSANKTLNFELCESTNSLIGMPSHPSNFFYIEEAKGIASYMHYLITYCSHLHGLPELIVKLVQ